MNFEVFHQRVQASLLKTGHFFCRVKVQPGSSRTEFREILDINGDLVLKIALVTPPQKGKANKELLHFLETLFQCQVRLVSGTTNAFKQIELFN